MVWTILVLQKPFDWAERCCLEIRRWNNCWRICRLVSSCIIIYACVFESVTTSMLMIILLRVNPRDIPFCKVGNGTYKIFTDSILIIIFGFIHSRWWRRVSIADFLSWLALLNISSKLYIAFAPLYLSFVFYPLGHVFPSFVIQNSLLVYLGLAFVWFQTSSCIISTDIERSQLPANNQKDSQSSVVFILFVFSDLSMDQKIQ